jgi:hypothetical protein
MRFYERNHLTAHNHRKLRNQICFDVKSLIQWTILTIFIADVVKSDKSAKCRIEISPSKSHGACTLNRCRSSSVCQVQHFCHFLSSIRLMFKRIDLAGAIPLIPFIRPIPAKENSCVQIHSELLSLFSIAFVQFQYFPSSREDSHECFSNEHLLKLNLIWL